MSYSAALEAAGAKVLAWQSFRSYQGDWWAKVEYRGNTGWVTGSYGSCSHCDAFQGEVGYSYYKDEESEEDYTRRLADFGKQYLHFMLTQDEAEASASANLDWDLDAEDMVNFVKGNA